ncbi:MAG: shikimate kinase [Flavobacteriales bacterium]|nr:shikimate kinase [Flavobacteriales bacterium]MBL6873242.1 shikimate kinase [Flavobacteriales bacterium]
MTIFLVGYMGSGKSTLGQKLAYNLKHDFIDLDKYIEEQEGRTIKEIFDEDGEDYFRKLERLYLHRVIDTEDTVISTGGGTPCHFDNMEQMNEYGMTVYINMHPKALIPRLQKSAVLRPLIEGLEGEELLDYVYKTLREREGFYHKAQKVVTGYNLNAKKLQEYCLEE